MAETEKICNLPFETLDFIDVNNRNNINGKTLNKKPKELYENDKYLLNKVLNFYKNFDEITGENLNGTIEHIELLEKLLIDIKKVDNDLAQLKYEFLLRNDCNLKVDDLFPCKNLNKCESFGYFDNTHFQYDEDYQNAVCGCDDISDCK